MRYSNTFRTLMVALLLVLMSCPSFAVTVTVIRVKTDGNDANNGSTWALAKQHVQAAIDAAVSGDEIWVKAGTYPQLLTLKNGVSVYGGFAGAETSRSQRNPAANVTILDGSSSGRVVSAPTTATSSTVLDGFTIQNGSSDIGAGIFCDNGSAPIISNNILTANARTGYGGAVIYCGDACSASIICNKIRGNPQSAIYLRPSTPATIASNLIAANTGAGINCEYPNGATKIVNNTIVDNNGAGVYCYHQSVTVANNILGFNQTGLVLNGSGPEPTIQNNCVYGNNYDYSGNQGAPGPGDFSEDPLFANRGTGDYHLTGSSPCLNSGSNSISGIPALDFDGDTRILVGTVDIGADEFATEFAQKPTLAPDAGTYGQPQSVVVSCGTSGAVIHYTTNGSEPTESSPTVASGGTVAVTASLTLKAKAWKTALPPSSGKTAVYTLVVTDPTFAPEGSVLSSPVDVTVSCASAGAVIRYTTNGVDPTESSTVIASGGVLHITQSTVLKAKAFRSGWTSSGIKRSVYRFGNRLYVDADSPGPSEDGFAWQTAFHTVAGALAESVSGDEIWVAAGHYVGCITMRDGVALYGGFAGNETLLSQRNWNANTSILDGAQVSNTVSAPSGVTASARIDGFTITGGIAGPSSFGGGGIICISSSPVIANNIITGNTAVGGGTVYGGGIRCYASDSVVTNNLIVGNTGNYGGGVAFDHCSAKLVNNTIVGNTANADGGGFFWYASPMTAQNNIIAFNSSGVCHWASIAPTYEYNCVFGNTAYNYKDAATGNPWDPTGTSGNISVDPAFVDSATGNYHISSSSGCKNVGYNSATGLPSIDFDGQARIYNTTVDIGADEFWAATNTPTFAPDAGTYATAQNVAISCTTAGSTIHYTTNGFLPSESDPIIASGSTVPIDRDTILKARAWKPGAEPSLFKVADYVITEVLPPSFSPDGGTFNYAVNVVVTCPTAGVTIHYTTNGATPTESDPSVASGGSVPAASSMTLKAKAFKTGWTASPVKSAAYTIVNRLLVDQNCPSPDPDGFTWATAFKYISDAMDAAVAGNEIWVADGTYKEPVALNEGISLYGGFAGVETSLGQRNWNANVCILEWNDGSVVTFQGQATGSIVDGFTIRGGSAEDGGGIYCNGSSPTISHNIIRDNSAAAHGGGLFCGGKASPTIHDNLFINNLSHEVGGGICSDGGEPRIANNTLVGNEAGEGGGIACLHESSAAISNNIIAFNSSGIFSTDEAPVLRRNCVGQNHDYDYSGSPPGDGDLDPGTDPRLVDPRGDLHLSDRSPCIDAGDQRLDEPEWTDMDAKARVFGDEVDIGAFEIAPVPTPVFNPDGRINNEPFGVVVTCAVPDAVIHYTTSGLDPTEGDPVIASGGTVPITSSLILKAQAYRPGWFPSLVKSASYGITNVIYVDADASGQVHHGFTWQTACITVEDGLRTAVRGNEIWVAAHIYGECNRVPSEISLYGGFTGAETARDQRDWVRNATVLDGGRDRSVLSVDGGSPSDTIIDGFTIRNGAGDMGGGIFCNNASPTIANNIITDNSVKGQGAGVFCSNGSCPLIVNNILTYNLAGVGAGVACTGEASIPSILNNVFVANEAESGAGIACLVGASPTIKNNIVSFNTCGIYSHNGLPIEDYNCLYENHDRDYEGLDPGKHDVGNDPLFVSLKGRDFHLTSTSPCIDKGDKVSVQYDMDGAIRPQDGNSDMTAVLDIGAYEYPLDLGYAKANYPGGQGIAFGCVSVSARFAGIPCLYVQRANRSCGIRVDTPETPAAGRLVNVSGTIETDGATGERYVLATPPWPDPMPGNLLPVPMGLPIRSLGGNDSGLQGGILGSAGLNNIGLLVRVWGKVKEIGHSYLILDDGSGTDLMVDKTGLTIDPTWEYLSVTGISSCRLVSGHLERLLRVENQSDIVFQTP